MAAGCSGCVGPGKIAMLNPLTAEQFKLAETLDAEDAISQTGISEWGSIHNVVTGTAKQILDVITVMELNVAPQTVRELEIAVKRTSECETTWNLLAIGRLFQYTINNMWAIQTSSNFLLQILTSSQTTPSAALTTGVYIEDTCTVSAHWQNYGLTVHSPDDIPLCSRGDVCIHNYFNSLWEWVNYQTADRPDRVGMIVNSFRSRYADHQRASGYRGYADSYHGCDKSLPGDVAQAIRASYADLGVSMSERTYASCLSRTNHVRYRLETWFYGKLKTDIVYRLLL
ncbi:unnamed protein product [Phytophthora lilii]|uniref:Unnamed protein product n=1 Tax=Phytophthora lilii TaxID=2077276 RepID=A0A9W6TX54_9STRA|nr:unnamed protein product [Phytophthora lilii]